MSSIVSNATPLIYLAKAKKLKILKEIYEIIIIPEQVKYEVVDKGKQLGEKDAYIIEKAIKEGWIKVHKTSTLKIPIKIEAGEAAAI